MSATARYCDHFAIYQAHGVADNCKGALLSLDAVCGDLGDLRDTAGGDQSAVTFGEETSFDHLIIAGEAGIAGAPETDPVEGILSDIAAGV